MEKVGAAKFLSPEVTLKATRLVTRGKVYQLGQVLSENVPQLDDEPLLFGPGLGSHSDIKRRPRSSRNAPR